MSELILNLAFAILVVSVLLGVIRLSRGPTIVDRILAFDAVVLCAVGLTVLLSDFWQTPHFLELILIVSSLGFFGTVAFAAYLQRAEVRSNPAEPIASAKGDRRP